MKIVAFFFFLCGAVLLHFALRTSEDVEISSRVWNWLGLGAIVLFTLGSIFLIF